MSANINSAGVVRQLDKLAEPDEQVTEEHVQDAPRLARVLMSILRDVARLKRRWAPRRVDFEDKAVDATGTTKYRFPHGFGGRVRWFPVGWSAAAGAPSLREDDDTDDHTLVLVSSVAGTVTLRIEEAG